MNKYDVVVIGAGPAGLMAARELAKNNINFLVIDSKKEIGVPLKCGEGIREKGFVELFGKGNYSFIKNRVDTIKIIYEKLERTIHAPYLELDRVEFEKWLAEPVKKRIKLRTRCKDVSVENDYAEVITDKGVFKADCVILAYGCDFRIQQKHHLTKKKPRMFICYGGIFENHKLDPNKLYFFFDNKYFCGFWVFPKDKKTANAGVSVELKDGRGIRELFYALAKKYGFVLKEISNFSGVYPSSGPIEKTHSNRLLVCGNAAGMIHSGTGEGIYYALKSGKIAAETVVKGHRLKRFDRGFLKLYEKRWKKEFGGHMNGGKIFLDLCDVGYKYHIIKKMFHQTTEKEIKGITVDGKIAVRLLLAWKITRIFKLESKKKKIPKSLKILWKVFRFLKIAR